MTTAAAARAMPHDAEAERSLLAGLLLNNAALAQCAGMQPSDFYVQAHRHVFKAVLQLAQRGMGFDLLSVRDQLGPDVTHAGGIEYLSGLLDGVPRVAHVGQWAGIVRRHASARRLHAIGERLALATLEDDADPQKLLESADAELLKLFRRGGEGRGLLDNARLAKAALANIEARAMAPHGILGYRTELQSLDAILQGVRDGTVLIVAARPSEGKTILLAQVGEAIAAQAPDKLVVFSSLEMDGEEVMERRLSKAALVNSNRLWCAPADKREERFQRLARAVGPLAVSNLRILTDSWTVGELRSWCRQAQQEFGLAAVCVDYVQLMEAERARGFRKRFEEVSDISKALKRLAKELAVPVIVAAQLNRELLQGGKRRPPELSDLAESGQLERDAHQVVMIDKDPLVPEGGKWKPLIGAADLYVRKNRGGTQGKTRLRLNGALSQFQEWEDAQKGGDE